MIQAINIQPTYCKPQKVCKRNVSEPKKYSSIAFRGNENPKQVAFISFETVPINKTGGMADVVGELAPELNKLGMDVRVIIPLLNAQNGIVLNNNGQQIYKTPKGKEFLINDMGLDFNYTYGCQKGKGRLFKINDERVKFPVYLTYCPDDVSKNRTEYQGWIMDQVKNQEAFSKASLEALKLLNNNVEKFNPKYVMSYEWTTAPIIEAMSNDEYYKDKIKIANINNFGPVYQGRVGAPVVSPYIISKEELTNFCNDSRTKALLNEIGLAVKSRAGETSSLNINKELSEGDYLNAYLKIVQNYEKYIPYTTNHLGFLDTLLMDKFPNQGWFNGYYNFYVPAVRKADSIVSCSATYIKELADEDRYSDGVANIMNQERLKSYGITIGMDYSLHNPAATAEETSKPIKYPFSVNESELLNKTGLLDYKSGKRANKLYLQSMLSKNNVNIDNINESIGVKQYGYLNNNKDAFVSTFITRYDPQQKGVDIAIKASEMLLEQEKDAQMILAGPDFCKDYSLIKEYIKNVVEKYPGRAVLCDGFINNIAQFYAGSDTVLIPSRFAPFELVQLQGMRMGAVPIVSNAGGLAEIIVDPADGPDNKILGFKTKESLFLSKDPYRDYCNTIKRAINTYKNEPQKWDTILRNDLKFKQTWDLPAKKYVNTVFNLKNYNNIRDLFYIDSRFTTGEIASFDNDKMRQDIEYLKSRGFSQIVQIDKENADIKNLANQFGIKYKTVELGDTPSYESVVNLLKEIADNDEKNFFNESQGKNNKSVLASLYLSFSSDDSVDEIMKKIWAERNNNFENVIWGDKNKIKNIMNRLSILGEICNHDFSKLTVNALMNVNLNLLNSVSRKAREFLKKIADTNNLKEVVYSGRHYIK